MTQPPTKSPTIGNTALRRSTSNASPTCTTATCGLPVAVFCITVAIGLACTALVVASMRTSTKATVRASLEREAADILALGVSGSLERVNAIPVFASTFYGRTNRSHPVTQAQFDYIVRQYGLFGGDEMLVASMSFNAFINDTERAAFEESAGTQLRYYTQFNRLDPGGSPTAVFAPHERESYFTLVIGFPTARLNVLKWRDMSLVNAERGAAIMSSGASGKPVATSTITNFVGKVIPFHQAVPTSQPEVRAMDGALMFQVYVSAFSQLYGSADDRAARKLQVTLTDMTKADKPALMFSDIPEVEADGLGAVDSLPPSTQLASTTFVAASRTWTATVTTPYSAIDEAAAAQLPLVTVWLLGACVSLVIAALVVILVVLSRMRRRAQEEALRQKTAAGVHISMLRLVNHELRNPLTVVRAGLELVADDLSSMSTIGGEAQMQQREQLNEEVTVVAGAAQSMQRALDALLDMDQVQSGNLKLEREVFDPRSVARDVRHYVSVFTSEHHRPRLFVSRHVPPRLVGDAQRLRQVVVGVVYHLYEYGSDAGLAIHVGFHNKAWLMITVGGLDTLPENANKRLLGRDSPSETTRQLQQDGWQPLTTRHPKHRHNTNSVSSGSDDDNDNDKHANFRLMATSSEDVEGEITTSLGTFTLDMCKQVVAAMRGSLEFWTTDDEQQVLVVAIPTEAGSSPMARATSTPFQHADTQQQQQQQQQHASHRHSNGSDVVVQMSPTGAGTGAGAGAGAGTAAGPDATGQISFLDGASNSGMLTVAVVGGRAATPSSGAVSPSLPGADDDGAVCAPGLVAVMDAPTMPTTPPAVTAGKSVPFGTSQASSTSTAASSSKPAPRATSGRPRPGGGRPRPGGRARPRLGKINARSKRSVAAVADAGRHAVVVVDDERMIRSVVQRQLGSLRVPVVGDLEDGDQLLKHLESLPAKPTCVLLDIVMRRSEGVAVLTALRQTEKWSSLPVYAMTSNVEGKERYRMAGFNGLLGKPFGRGGLEQVLVHSMSAAGSIPNSSNFLVASQSK